MAIECIFCERELVPVHLDTYDFFGVTVTLSTGKICLHSNLKNSDKYICLSCMREIAETTKLVERLINGP